MGVAGLLDQVQQLRATPAIRVGPTLGHVLRGYEGVTKSMGIVTRSSSNIVDLIFNQIVFGNSWSRRAKLNVRSSKTGRATGTNLPIGFDGFPTLRAIWRSKL